MTNNHSLNNYFYIVFLIILFISFSCETEVDDAVYMENIPVVYSLINPDDSIHYVKLTKTIQAGNNTNKVVKIVDSLYYENPDVKLEIRTQTGWGVYKNKFEKTIDYLKEPGYFGSGRNEFYQLDANFSDYLIEGYDIFLIIDIPGKKKTASASSKIIPYPKITQPININNKKLKISDTIPLDIRTYGCLKCDYYYEFIFRLNFTEVKIDSRKDISADLIKKNYIPGARYLEYGYLFRKIASLIEEDPEVIRREFIGIDIIIQETGKDFPDYVELGMMAADNTGKAFTNIVNGIGIFACIFEDAQKGFGLERKSRDSLKFGQYTKHLKFVVWE